MMTMMLTDEFVRSTVVGIHFGASTSSIAVWTSREIDVILNDFGDRTTTSCVCFLENERLVGPAAWTHAILHRENAIFEIARLLGRRFDDSRVQRDMQSWPFAVVDRGHDAEGGVGGDPAIRLHLDGVPLHFRPVQIASMILEYLKGFAGDYLGKPITHAVLSVPVTFGEGERQAVLEAADLAGLKVLRVLDDATSACMAYGSDISTTSGSTKKGTNAMVFHLGGATCDCCILRIHAGNFEVVAHQFDEFLGGKNFDTRLLEFCVGDFQRRHQMDLKTSVRAIDRLRRMSEIAKKRLSTEDQATLQLDCLMDGLDYTKAVSRARFEQLNSDLFRACLKIIRSCVVDSGLQKPDIHEVILTGGSCRIPKIQQLISDYFNGMLLKIRINPDEVCAFGAAVHAAIVSKQVSCAEDIFCPSLPTSPLLPTAADHHEEITIQELRDRALYAATYDPIIEDAAKLERIRAKNSLESYCYEVKNSLEREVALIRSACDDMIDWLDSHQEERTESYDERKRELTFRIDDSLQKIVRPGEDVASTQPSLAEGANPPRFEDLDVD